MTATGTLVQSERLVGGDFDEVLERFFVELEFGTDLDSGPGDPSKDLRHIAESAVDPLEIAAALEAAGISTGTIKATFGDDDVFSLAARIYRRMPLRIGLHGSPDAPMSGSRRDLARGAIFAVPGVAITEVLRVSGLALAWWVLPIAVAFGWALSQAIASVGYVLRARRDVLGSGTMFAAFLTFAIAGSFGVFAVASAMTGAAPWPTAAVGMAFVAYMAASAILILHDRERVLAWALIPSIVACLAAWTVGRWADAAWVAMVAQTAAVGYVVVVAGTYGRWGRITKPKLGRADVRAAAEHFVHGAFCGVTVAVVLVATIQGSHPRVTSLSSWPLLLSLGVMEWQHRTLGASVWRLRHGMTNVSRFSTMSGWAFCRAVASYALAVVALCVLVGLVERSVHLPGSPPLLMAQAVLGTTLFVDLIAIAHAGVRRTLAVWMLGAAFAGAAFAAAAHWGLRPDADARWAVALVAGGTFFMVLTRVTWKSIRSPFI